MVFIALFLIYLLNIEWTQDRSHPVIVLILSCCFFVVVARGFNRSRSVLIQILSTMLWDTLVISWLLIVNVSLPQSRDIPESHHVTLLWNKSAHLHLKGLSNITSYKQIRTPWCLSMKCTKTMIHSSTFDKNTWAHLKTEVKTWELKTAWPGVPSGQAPNRDVP